MRIDGPQITGSLSLNGDGLQDLDALVTTSSLNTYTSSVDTTMGHVMTATHSLNTFTSSADSRMISIESKTGSYATTGSNTFIGTQTTQGSIIPSDDSTYDLGSPSANFRHLYLSSASLYIDGTKVLGSTSQELQITTDNGQSFKILEAGSDTITLQSADGNITLATSGGGDVILDPTTGIIALKGTTQVYSGNKVRSSDGNNIVFGDGLTVSGSVTITGFIEAQELRTTYISSSILYRSGSTKFGDELTDTHAFTGSLLVSGSLSAIGSNLVSGSSQIILSDTSGFGAYLNQGVLTTSTPIFDSTTISGGTNSSQTLNLTIDATNGAASELVIKGGDVTYNRRAAIRFYSNQISTSTAQWVLGSSLAQSNGDSNFYLYSSGGTATITTTQSNYFGINRTDPGFYLDVKAEIANSFYTIAQFENKDYTAGTRTFIRVRNWLTAGGSYSSYFGQGQDGKTYIIANDSGRGGDIVINGSNGFIGINKSSPTYRFEIYDAAPSGGILANLESGNASGWFRLNSTGSTWQIGATTLGLEFYNETNTATRVRISPNGNVGINITPSYTLDVNGGSAFRDTLRILASDVNAAHLSWTSTNTGLLNLYHGGTLSTQILASGLSFFNGSIRINQDAALRAGSSDNWIIGQDSSTNLIHLGSTAVANDIRFDSSTAEGIVIITSDGTLYTKNSLRFNGTGLNATDKKLYSPTDGDLEWMTHTSAGGHGFAVSHQGTKKVYLNASGNSYFIGGNLGIGISSPDYNLDIQGTEAKIQIKSTATGGGTWVMASTYNSWSAGGGKYVITSDGGSGGIKFSINSSGQVGVNTYSQSARFEVKAAGDEDLIVGRYSGGSAKLFYVYQSSADGYLELRTGADATVTKLSGYAGTPAYMNTKLTVGGTSTYTASTLSVEGALKVNRTIYNWYQAGTNAWDGYAHLHLKTNMWAGGSPNGNIHYTMSLFHAKLYSYSSPYIREGNIGFHNWSGVHYSLVTTGNIWTTAYTSSDGYTVLVIALGSGTYFGVTVDWHQAYGYPFQDKIVTAVSPSNSSSGVY